MTTEQGGGSQSTRSSAVEPLEQRLRPALDEVAVARVWRGIRAQREERLHARSPRADVLRRASLAFAGAVSVAAMAAIIVLASAPPSAPRAPGALRAVTGDAALATVLRPSAVPMALDDGSELVVARATDMEVLANDGTRFVTLIRRGRCHFAVKPGGPRRWTIETDLATVEVLGTEFTVERGERGLEVAVDRGVVLVRGERVPGRATRLRAGERLVVPDVESTPSAPVAAHARPEVPSSASSAGAVARERRPLVVEPVPPTSPARDEVDAPLAAADAARAAGHFEEAARLLGDVMRESASEPRGALAAFSLGKLQLEELGRPAQAAETFAWVVRRGSPRGLVEDAQARRVEALARAGRVGEAAAEARAYEARWPDGRRLAEVRALVSE